MPGVERVQMCRNSRITFRGTPVMVVAVEMNSVRETAHDGPGRRGRRGHVPARRRRERASSCRTTSRELQHVAPGRHARHRRALRRRFVCRSSASSSTTPTSRAPCSWTAACSSKYWHDDCGERFPRLHGAGRPGRARRAAAHHRRCYARQAARVRADERGRGAATSCGSPDQWFGLIERADRDRGARRGARHRQHADGVDHGSAARARRPAGGRRRSADRFAGRSGSRR